MSAGAKVVSTKLENWRMLDNSVEPSVDHLFRDTDSAEFSDEPGRLVTTPSEFELHLPDLVDARERDLSNLPASEELNIDWVPVTSTVEFDLYFRNLVEAWKRDTSHISLMSLRVSHPAYKEIISMGRQALPLILAELDEKPDHWFHALSILADENPVSAGFCGTVREAAALWVAWGRDKKLIADAA